MKRVLLLGRPGSGKGTVAKKLLKDFNFVHMSTGELLRSEIQDGTTLGREANTFMQRGEFVPDELVLGIVRNFTQNHIKRNAANLLLDGFPRKVSQAKSLETFLPIDLVVNIDAPPEVIADRISKRWVHTGSGRVYNLDYSPPIKPGVDDITNEPLTQREDDQPDVVINRLSKFDVENDRIIAFYNGKKETLLRQFSGTETDKIYPGIHEWLIRHIQPK